MIDSFVGIISWQYCLPIVGFIVAVIGCVIGGGGGFIFFPVLTMVYGVDPHIAISASLMSTLPIVLVGSITHKRNGNVHHKFALQFMLSGAIGVTLGFFLSSRLSNEWLNNAFGLYTMILGLSILYKTYVKREKDVTESIPMGGTHRIKTYLWGMSAGTITGAFGTNGTAPIISGLIQLKLPLKHIVGTSLSIVLVNGLLASASHIAHHNYDVHLILWLSIGSIPGALIGSRWLVRKEMTNSGQKIKVIYALVIIGVGLLMTLK